MRYFDYATRRRRHRMAGGTGIRVYRFPLSGQWHDLQHRWLKSKSFGFENLDVGAACGRDGRLG
jgi:hypothetical protein